MSGWEMEELNGPHFPPKSREEGYLYVNIRWSLWKFRFNRCTSPPFGRVRLLVFTVRMGSSGVDLLPCFLTCGEYRADLELSAMCKRDTQPNARRLRGEHGDRPRICYASRRTAVSPGSCWGFQYSFVAVTCVPDHLDQRLWTTVVGRWLWVRTWKGNY